MSGFDPHDPEIQTQMEARGRHQTALAKLPLGNGDPYRAAAAAARDDPTSILDDDLNTTGFLEIAEEWRDAYPVTSQSFLPGIPDDALLAFERATRGLRVVASSMAEATAVFERIRDLIASGQADTGVVDAHVTCTTAMIQEPYHGVMRTYAAGPETYVIETVVDDPPPPRHLSNHFTGRRVDFVTIDDPNPDSNPPRPSVAVASGFQAALDKAVDDLRAVSTAAADLLTATPGTSSAEAFEEWDRPRRELFEATRAKITADLRAKLFRGDLA